MNCKNIATKGGLLLFLMVCCAIKGTAQTGTFNYVFTPTDGGAEIRNSIVLPLTKYNNYDNYWFVNPNTGDRHLMVNGAYDVGIIVLDDRADTSITFRYKYEGDQFNILTKDKNLGYITPDNDHKPLRIHYNVFTAGEIYLTFAGNAVYTIAGPTPGTTTKVHGIISGTLQAFREPRYEQSDKYAGCNSCDPTIYARFYDEEIGRTPSACENALLWDTYNKLQRVLTKLVPNVGYAGDHPPSGTTIYRPKGGTVDITGPLSTIEPCNPKNPRQGIVAVNAHQFPFEKENYEINFLKLPTPDELKPPPGYDPQTALKKIMVVQDSLRKLWQAKKITSEQLDAKMKVYYASMATGMPDIKRMEIDHNLKVTVLINALSAGHAMGYLVDEYYHPVIQHNIPGATLEVFVPATKVDAENWLPNRLYVYYGKFNVVSEGGRIKSITPVYDPKINKLTIINATVVLEGGKELIDKAVANIDFNQMSSFVPKPKTN